MFSSEGWKSVYLFIYFILLILVFSTYTALCWLLNSFELCMLGCMLHLEHLFSGTILIMALMQRLARTGWKHNQYYAITGVWMKRPISRFTNINITFQTPINLILGSWCLLTPIIVLLLLCVMRLVTFVREGQVMPILIKFSPCSKKL